MSFVCTVLEQGDEMSTLLSMDKQLVECNLERSVINNCVCVGGGGA